MNGMQIFTYHTAEVRAVTIDNEPWFVLKDVCVVLEIDNPRNVAARLDEYERGVHRIDTLGGKQEMTVISESGLYSTILLSRKPEAKQFKRWIMQEVLPSIRKHGAYMTPAKLEEALLNPDTMIKVLTALKDEQAKVRTLEQTIENQKPQVIFANAVSISKTSILVGEMAKILKQNGVEIGQNRMFEWLRVKGYLISRRGSDYNMPTQYSMERGLFEIKETSITHSDGHVTINKTPKVTGKGQIYFINKFKSA